MFIIFTQVFNKLKSRVTLMAWAAATLVCALTGPFETYDLDTLNNRLFFWGIVLLSGVTYCLLCLHTMFHVFPNLRPLYSKSIAITFFTITFSEIIYIAVDFIYLAYKPLPMLQLYAVVGSI